MPVWLKAMTTKMPRSRTILGWNRSTLKTTNSLKRRWVLAFDGGHRWRHMTTSLVECINSVLKDARNLPVTAIVRSTFYRLNELFTRKSTEPHERVCNKHKYLEFATKRVEKINIVVNRFDRRNEMFEVRELQDGSFYTVSLAQ
ncbi:hypothetical protein Ahy_A01g003110 [Arachis hypogaea]|uniref:Uncharacterized protein n=1 Tax=Arachis hypogaea TaxID=3818 RepID=A0A445ESH1_ARAHY|nr:hypothetical protein Ahy_A01g003110 [Arachis hypogaea]